MEESFHTETPLANSSLMGNRNLAPWQKNVTLVLGSHHMISRKLPVSCGREAPGNSSNY